ncbi:probable ubiquitin carboxyl-terminal hydrolase creB isoform X2 [Morone saxatilis]|nr:probable ubiquitin carboxyl-terminal hydrolase creB isoform X2 [Morone saxatilis]
MTSPEAARMFKGELIHRASCLKCKERNDSRSFFWILPVAVEDLCHQTYSVERGLKAFFNRENVAGENKMYCNHCNKKQDANFGCKMTQNPEVLTLLLKRFRFDYKCGCYVKLHCKVDIPQTLHIKNCDYDLYALVNHFGSLTGGHYTAQIKSFETQVWYNFNDDIVKKIKPLFVAEDKPLRSSTAYLLMYRKVRRNLEKTDEDLEANCAHSYVEAEERHVEAGREVFVRHPQPMDESCNGEPNLNGDILKRSHEDTFFGELGKERSQRAACVRPHKEMLPQTETTANGETSKPSLQTQKASFTKLQNDAGQKRHEPDRQQLDTNSKEHMCPLNTGGSFTVNVRKHNSEQNHESLKEGLKANETIRETKNRSFAKTGTKTSETYNLTKNRVKSAETEAVAEVRMERKSKLKREAGVSENVHHPNLTSVFFPGYPSSSPSPNRKSNSSRRDKRETQRPDSSRKLHTTQTVTKGEETASPTKKRRAQEDKRNPWK